MIATESVSAYYESEGSGRVSPPTRVTFDTTVIGSQERAPERWFVGFANDPDQRRRPHWRPGTEPGRGLPRRDKTAGDLYAIVRIVVPTSAGKEERALYQQLADISRFDPRAAR